MVTPLQANILQLARSEHDLNRLPEYLDLIDNEVDTPALWPVVLASDRLIGYLFKYGQRYVSIGDNYFQPYLGEYPHYVIFDWRGYGSRAFCKGCAMQEWGCRVCPFSSECDRFRIAWAVEHVTAATNQLLKQKLGGRSKHPQA